MPLSGGWQIIQIPPLARSVGHPTAVVAAASSPAPVGCLLLTVPPLPLLASLSPLPPLAILALKCVSSAHLRLATVGRDPVEGRLCWPDLLATTSLLADLVAWSRGRQLTQDAHGRCSWQEALPWWLPRPGEKDVGMDDDSFCLPPSTGCALGLLPLPHHIFFWGSEGGSLASLGCCSLSYHMDPSRFTRICPQSRPYVDGSSSSVANGRPESTGGWSCTIDEPSSSNCSARGSAPTGSSSAIGDHFCPIVPACVARMNRKKRQTARRARLILRQGPVPHSLSMRATCFVPKEYMQVLKDGLHYAKKCHRNHTVGRSECETLASRNSL
ncbi:uncharacterized protein LOC102722064 isoform X9 [Oryza brachyantha]|uniref:uncharacterized protein LOC102722064 isoform X9 n=1 Tax=Oryza brachyantha TaxID=4533 RepID=UPI001ADD2E4A|nr:uncharacterized protein LOC102722064 isoform X9 [Oryza brachyantha]